MGGSMLAPTPGPAVPRAVGGEDWSASERAEAWRHDDGMRRLELLHQRSVGAPAAASADEPNPRRTSAEPATPHLVDLESPAASSEAGGYDGGEARSPRRHM
jgi:hypothetical protein